MRIYYDPKLKQLSRELRKKGNLAEVLLWKGLKARQMKGYQFMRQKPIGQYIVDFYCSKLKLVIEIDGYSHEGKLEADSARQRKLESLGLHVLRFLDSAVRRNVNGMLAAVGDWIEQRCSPRRFP